jgi:large conductance mechanosensitive channel
MSDRARTNHGPVLLECGGLPPQSKTPARNQVTRLRSYFDCGGDATSRKLRVLPQRVSRACASLSLQQAQIRPKHKLLEERMLKGFKQFLLRGNVVDMAVGIVIGAAFGAVVTGLVKDLLTPFIAAIVKAPDFSGLSFELNGSKFLYGDFLNALISFIIVAAAVYFFVVLPINALIARARKEPPADPTTKKCPECLSEIPIAARKCAFCTSQLA